MDPRHGPEAEEFRTRIRKLIADNLPSGWQGIGAIESREEADAFVESWRGVLAGNGLLGVSWPREYGGAGFTKVEQVVLVEELARVGVPNMGYNDTFGIKMLGGTLLHWGTEAHLQELFPAAATIDHVTRAFTFRYRSPEHFVDVFRRFYGPVHQAFAVLDAYSQAALEDELKGLLRSVNFGGPTSLVVPGEYLETVIVR